jgi:hypothetical protein
MRRRRIRALLGVPEDKLLRMPDLLRNCINVAVAEVNSFLDTTHDTIYSGRVPFRTVDQKPTSEDFAKARELIEAQRQHERRHIRRTVLQDAIERRRIPRPVDANQDLDGPHALLRIDRPERGLQAGPQDRGNDYRHLRASLRRNWDLSRDRRVRAH